MPSQMTAGAAPADRLPQSLVRVELGARSYDIAIGSGLLAGAGRAIGDVAGGSRAVIVTDANVAPHHLAGLEAAVGRDVGLIASVILQPGEATKSFAELEHLCRRLLELEVERGDVVVAFGGGVVGDLVGFAASILRRGVRTVQVPTTLLAQVDSSVGGKTGINVPEGKNLIGSFHQPALVIADTDVLDTLPERQFRSGYAEVAKYGLLGDAEFFAWLETNWRALFAGDPGLRVAAIEASCKAKAAIVAADEFESGRRALLNLGHTFGHALEAWAGYSGRLLHGEAIAIGMAQAFRYSVLSEFCDGALAERVEAHFGAVGLPTRLDHIEGGGPEDADVILSHMGQDKKVWRGRLVFILARGIGEAFVCDDVEMEPLRAFLSRECGQSGAAPAPDR